MKRVLITLGALGLAASLSALALAQAPVGSAGVGSVPAPGLITGFQNYTQTYTAGYIGLASASSATDVVCIAGSATKTIAVTKIQLSGTSSTLVTLPITLVRRTSVDTSGTAASTTANPANNIAKHDTNNATATAVPISYTANPTINDSSPTYLQTANVTMPVTTAGTSIVPIHWTYGNIATGEQPLILRGAAAQLCLNFNGVTVATPVITGSLTWYEY